MNTTSAARQTLSNDFSKVMEDIEALVSATTNKAEGEAKVLRTRIHDRLDDAKDRLADAQHDAVAKAKYAVQATDGYVHTHPWQVVGAAAAVGLAIGMLISRR